MPGEGRAFGSISEAILAMDEGTLDLGAKVKLRLTGYADADGNVTEGPLLVETTLGRAIFNEALPTTYPYFERVADKGSLSGLVNDLAERFPKVEVAATLDRIKDAGFYWATRSGVTVALSDIVTPSNKAEILAVHEKAAAAVQKKFERGLITPSISPGRTGRAARSGTASPPATTALRPRMTGRRNGDGPTSSSRRARSATGSGKRGSTSPPWSAGPNAATCARAVTAIRCPGSTSPGAPAPAS